MSRLEGARRSTVVKISFNVLVQVQGHSSPRPSQDLIVEASDPPQVPWGSRDTKPFRTHPAHDSGINVSAFVPIHASMKYCLQSKTAVTHVP